MHISTSRKLKVADHCGTSLQWQERQVLCCFSAFSILVSLFVFSWMFGNEARRRFDKVTISVFVFYRMLFC